MLDYSTCPLTIWADTLEDTGADTSLLRAFFLTFESCFGDGYGSVYGYGDGYVYGYGHVYGFGYGYEYGSPSGFGSGYEYGSGYGYGDGFGYDREE